MLQLALVALLAGSLFAGGPDGDKNKKAASSEATTTAEEAVTSDTYAFGHPAEVPIKFWVTYGYGQVDERFDRTGESQDFAIGDADASIAFPGELTSQRLTVGGQLNLINFKRFKVGAGAQLTAAQNTFEYDGDVVVGNRRRDGTTTLGDPTIYNDNDKDRFGAQQVNTFQLGGLADRGSDE